VSWRRSRFQGSDCAMRILGVVTLVSPTGEYGGPTRVAINQLRALQARGHEVILAGSHRGFLGEVPDKIEGVPARLFPARTFVPGVGFAGLTSPALWAAVSRHASEFDVAHVHAARDLVTLPTARILQGRGVRVVLQTHGMIDETDNLLARPLDAGLTRAVLRRAHAVTYLTQRERASLDVVSHGQARLVELANGVPTDVTAAPIMAAPHLVFLARLAPRKRPVMFVRAASILAQEFPEARFTLFGPDEGEGGAVRAAIHSSHAPDRIRWAGPVAMEETLSRMREATVLVLPSVDEPYPMSVLEAMSVGVPVIVTDSCGLAPFVSKHDLGHVVDDSLGQLVAAMRVTLSETEKTRDQGLRARNVVGRERSMEAIAERLESLYR